MQEYGGPQPQGGGGGEVYFPLSTGQRAGGQAADCDALLGALEGKDGLAGLAGHSELPAGSGRRGRRGVGSVEHSIEEGLHLLWLQRKVVQPCRELTTVTAMVRVGV